jgi:serine/threonine protein kinase
MTNLLLDDFTIEGDLGQGGMGKVYLVRSVTNGRRFAVKRTKFSDWNGLRKFLLELQTWYGLPDHPHLAACRLCPCGKGANDGRPIPAGGSIAGAGVWGLGGW